MDGLGSSVEGKDNTKRLILDIDSYETVRDVFRSTDEQLRFIAAIAEMSDFALETDIKVGGRRLREMLDYSVIDFTDLILPSLAELSTKEIENLGPLRSILENYPIDRMKEPDLDFFYCGIDASTINEILIKHGFSTRILNALAGNVTIVEVKGNGIATFVSAEESWQIDKWPKFGIKASFEL